MLISYFIAFVQGQGLVEALSYVSDRKRATWKLGGIKEEEPGFHPLPAGLGTNSVVKLLSVSSLKARVLGIPGARWRLSGKQEDLANSR